MNCDIIIIIKCPTSNMLLINFHRTTLQSELFSCSSQLQHQFDSLYIVSNNQTNDQKQ